MNSDDYFDDDMDSAFLEQVDALEAAHTQAQARPQALATRPHPPRAQPRAPSPANPVIEIDDSYDFDTLDIDEADLQAIDQACHDALNGRKTPVAGPSKSGLQRTASAATVQTTLFGGVAEQPVAGPSTAAPHSGRGPQRRTSSATNLFLGKPNKTKKWDHTAFAKSGWKKPKDAKGKEKVFGSFDDEEEEEEPVEFEQFPAPVVSVGYVQERLLCMIFIPDHLTDLCVFSVVLSCRD